MDISNSCNKLYLHFFPFHVDGGKKELAKLFFYFNGLIIAFHDN